MNASANKFGMVVSLAIVVLLVGYLFEAMRKPHSLSKAATPPRLVAIGKVIPSIAHDDGSLTVASMKQRELVQVPGFDRYTAAAISNDGTALYVSGVIDGRPELWVTSEMDSHEAGFSITLDGKDMTTKGFEGEELENPPALPLWLSKSPNGRYLVGSLEDGSVWLWSRQGALWARLLSPGQEIISHLAWSSDSRTLVGVFRDVVIGWDMAHALNEPQVLWCSDPPDELGGKVDSVQELRRTGAQRWRLRYTCAGKPIQVEFKVAYQRSLHLD